MRQQDGRGVSQLDSLIQVMAVTGEIPEELEGPELPSIFEDLWSEFIHLANTTQMGSSGVEPIQPSEVEAWSRLTGASFRPWQVSLIFDMDRARRQVLIENQQKQQPKG